MVKNRDSIVKVGVELSDMVISGDGGTTLALDLAIKLRTMCRRVNAEGPQYSSHEERVLYRHLNLYKNKLKNAQTDAARAHWKKKIREQENRIERWKETGSNDLDLDGL